MRTVTLMKNKSYYPWIVVALLWFVALLNYMDRQMLATMRPSMEVDIAELKLATNFGFLMGIFLWVYGIMSPVAGIVADKLDRKWIIVCSLFVWSAVTMLMGFAESFNQLYWLRAIMGISEALYIPAALSLIADYHESRSRSLAIGIHMTGLYMGQALGGFGATISAALSWEHTFQMFGIIGLLYSLILMLFLHDNRKTSKGVITNLETPKKDFLRRLSSLLLNPAFWIILLYFTIPSLPGWATKNWLPTLASSTLKIDMSLAGPVCTITIAFSSFLGVIAGGILSDRWIERNVKGRMYTSAIGMGLMIPSLLLLGYGNTMWHIVGAIFCFGVGFGMFDANNMPIVCQFVSKSQRATAYGIMNMCAVFAGAFITDFLGKSTDQGNLGTSFALLSGVVFVALMIQLFFLRPRTKEYDTQVI